MALDIMIRFELLCLNYKLQNKHVSITLNRTIRILKNLNKKIPKIYLNELDLLASQDIQLFDAVYFVLIISIL